MIRPGLAGGERLPGRGMRETVEALVRASEGRTYIPELQQQQIPPHTSWSCRCNTLPLPTPRGSPKYSMKGELPDVEGRLTGSGQLTIGIDGWVNDVTSGVPPRGHSHTKWKEIS